VRAAHLGSQSHSKFSPDPGQRLIASIGEQKANSKFDQTTTAALAMVTSTMLNHDEAYMKR